MKTFAVLFCCIAVVTAQEWNARMVNVIPRAGRNDEGIKTILRIDANRLVCDSRKTRYCEIPFRSITRLAHDPQSRNRASVYGDSGGSCEGMGCAADLLVMAVLAPLHVRWEYVIVQWRDNDLPRTTYLRLSKTDFPSFEQEVAGRTQLTFENLTATRAARWQQIEQSRPEAMPVRLHRATFIRNEPVRGGLYQMVVLQTGPGSGDLYLFRGKNIDPKKPAWVVPVTIIASATESRNEAEPEYSPRLRWKNLERIRMPGRAVCIAP